MSGSLPCELNKFGNHAKRLREIMEETRRNFDEINDYAKCDGAQVVNAEFLQEEIAEVVSTVEKPPCLLVLGQNAYVKARIVNEIFNRLIFPVLEPDEGRNVSFRMVSFKHGHSPSVSLTLPDDYDLVESLEAYNGPWQCIPRGDLELTESEKLDPARGTAILEVSLNHPFLRSGARVKVSPCNHGGNIEQIMQKCIADVSPIILYGFNTDQLTPEDLSELTELKRLTQLHPVLFVRVVNTDTNISDTENVDSRSSRNKRRNSGKGPLSNFVNNYSLTNSKRLELNKSLSPRLRGVISPERVIRHNLRSSLTVFHQLCDLGFLTLLPGDITISKLTGDYFEMDSEFIEEFENFQTGLLLFVRKALKRYLINAATVLNNSHNRCLQMFILSAYDMARDMMITPKKLEFAREKEDELYKSLLDLTVSKHEEIKEIITQSLEVMTDVLIEKAALYDFIGVSLPDSGEVQTAKILQLCTGQIQDLVLCQLNQVIAGKLVSSINILHDTYTGTLTRCLESLEKSENGERGDSLPATDSLKQILNAAYQIEITATSSSSLMRTLFEKMKQLINSMPWKTPPKVDTEWKKKVASEMINSLNAARLAKSVSSQMKDRLSKSHESFTSALRQLESRHCGRLDKIEDERLRVRKVHAPKVAKLALESTSLKDVILHGMPQMGREIGRGQYGVVYACESWAGHSPSAIKSVVPPDDKHWNDLALEFYYTKNVPEHPRIASLRGSVIDYMYGGGTSPAVLLIMDRLQKDLYGAIKQGLDWLNRLQVAIDVVDGLRFLHSQGLVHRDIKLKNVLLDKHNRGKITDLGFCKPEAMMSGSIVGTPIHMAPELFTGKYLNWVDVYAFGILFWYICAGHVRLPSSFEQCANKDQLWQSVKKGLRPEKLQQFDDECWQMMQLCWEGEPQKRPLLGDVESQLYTILERFQKRLSTPQQKTKEVKLIAKTTHKIVT